MELPYLIDSLSRPEAYPHPFEDFQLHHTHISVVFLVDQFAYKIKKPVDLDFLDFTTLEKRRHFCEEEVRLNRRLASSVYLGVVQVTAENGGLRMGGDGEAVEYAVKMRRLPPGATFLARLERGELESAHVEELARRLAAFHAAIPPCPTASHYGGFEVVAGNARENLDQSRPHIGETISRPVFERLSEMLDKRLSELRPLIEARAAADVPRDTHGDLHLDHVYLFPEREPPSDLLVIDCIEFNERFRYADPVADAAFLAMDLVFRLRSDLALEFAEVYLETAGDVEGRRLMPFYIAYRADPACFSWEGCRGPERPPSPTRWQSAAASPSSRRIEPEKSWLVSTPERPLPRISERGSTRRNGIGKPTPSCSGVRARGCSAVRGFWWTRASDVRRTGTSSSRPPTAWACRAIFSSARPHPKP
jgi:aminoglycoside phosphotransferase family enzyme